MADFLSNIDLSATADGVANAASSGNWWDTGIEYATNAFDWMEKYPAATNVLAGVVGGVGQYYMGQQQLKEQQRFEREMMDRRREERQVKPAGIPGYGSHVATAKGGLLTNGMIIGEDD